jgi:micrococcal nuclease
VPSARFGVALGIAWLAGTLACAETPSARVRVVLDGDTIEVVRNGRSERVRLIGIDTPEAHDSPKLDRLVAQGQDRTQILALGRDATAFTRARLLGRAVELEFDRETRDRYGRTLAYVWLDGALFNATLVEAGHARLLTIPPNVRYVERFRVLERAARHARRGLWRAPAPAPHDQSRPSAASP